MAGVTSSHVIRCGEASQLRSLGPLLLRYHVTFMARGLGPSVYATEREWLAESSHPADIATWQAMKSQAKSNFPARTPVQREAKVVRYREA